MTRTERIQWQAFILLLVGVIASIYYFSDSSKDTANVSKNRIPLASRVNYSGETLPSLSTLVNKLPEFKGVQRNIFEFADGSSDEAVVLAVPEPLMIPQPVPLTPVRPDVTYLGFYREKEGSERKLAAISNGGQIYVGAEGSILGGKYRVIHVEDEFIEVEYLPENQILRLEIGRNGIPPDIK